VGRNGAGRTWGRRVQTIAVDKNILPLFNTIKGLMVTISRISTGRWQVMSEFELTIELSENKRRSFNGFSQPALLSNEL